MNRNAPGPPRILVRFFRWFCHPGMHRNIEGDLFELYEERREKCGKRLADGLFAIDVLLLFRPGIIKPAGGIYKLNNYGMFRNYLTIGWRNLWRNKAYSLINIGGLALGMAVTIIIGLWLFDELNHDNNFRKRDRLAAVLQNQTISGTVQTWWAEARQLAPVLREEYGSNFEAVITSSWPGEHKLVFGNQSLTRAGLFMEPEGPAMFTFNMVAGTHDGLIELNSIMISRSTAIALFGNTDALGKVIHMDDRTDVKVTGVYEDFPVNCALAYMSMICPFELLEKLDRLDERRVGWGNSWFRTFALVNENVNIEQASVNIREAKRKKVQLEDDARFKPELFLHPAKDWYLRSEFSNGTSVGGNIDNVWLFGTIGAFVLLLACINFMNINTARSEKRAREVGIRKAIGSGRPQLVVQFFSESLQVVIISFLAAIIIAQLSLPVFNSLAGKDLSILWNNPTFWIISVGVAIITGLLAGSYPALFLSSFKTAKVLKGTAGGAMGSTLPRKILVVLQFTVSVTLVIGTIVVFQQIKHAQNRPIGYDYNGLVLSPLRAEGIDKHFDAFRNDMLATGMIDEVALTDIPITDTGTTNGGFTWEGKDPNMTEEFNTLRVSFEFGKMIDWEIVEGRDFSRNFPSDSAAFLLNETAVKYMGITEPVGKIMTWNGNGDFKVVGVVKDLVTQSPYFPVRPMIFMISRRFVSQVNFKINAGANTADALRAVEPIFKKYDPANEFTYEFADVQYGRKFEGELRVARLASIMTGFAIVISCLGLFGLASYVAERRTREIGIRKVLGASVSSLWMMLSRDFVTLVVVASFLAAPLSLWLMNDWLSQYAYRTNVSGILIALAIAGAIVVTLLTVSYQTIKASVANPVKSLRTE